MRLDELARPFRVEQVGEALGRFFDLHELGVVGDAAQPQAPSGEQAVRVLVLGWEVLGNVLRHARQ